MSRTASELSEFARVDDAMRDPKAIFVFGSNRAGVHGGGAAKVAHERYGAKWHHGEGLSGRSYGIPTKDTHIDTLPLEAVKEHVDQFISFALAHPEHRFAVTRVGCGLAGFTDAEIAPLFAKAPSNCELPTGWREMAVLK